METDYLKDFMVFAETMNYTSAAKRLYISQPTLSSHISALEKEIGVPLVSRNRGGLSLTPAGKHLQSRGEDLLELLQTIVSECQEVDQSVVSLNIQDDSAYFNRVLDEARASYCRAHPEKRIETNIVVPPCGREDALDKGLIDFDIGRFMLNDQSDLELEDAYNTEGLDCFPQCKETLYFWMTSENACFDREKLELDDFQGKTILIPFGNSNRILGRQVQKAFRKAGVKTELSYQRYSSLHEYYMTDLNHCFGIVGGSIAQGIGLRQFPSSKKVFEIEGFALTTTVYTVYRSDILSADKLEFIDALRAVADALLTEKDKGDGQDNTAVES